MSVAANDHEDVAGSCGQFMLRGMTAGRHAGEGKDILNGGQAMALGVGFLVGLTEATVNTLESVQNQDGAREKAAAFIHDLTALCMNIIGHESAVIIPAETSQELLTSAVAYKRTVDELVKTLKATNRLAPCFSVKGEEHLVAAIAAAGGAA